MHPPQAQPIFDIIKSAAIASIGFFKTATNHPLVGKNADNALYCSYATQKNLRNEIWLGEKPST